MSDLKTTARTAYDTLQDLHAVVGDTPEMVAHHAALNEVRKLFASWSDFLAFIGIEQEQQKSGGTDKENPPPPPGSGG